MFAIALLIIFTFAVCVSNIGPTASYFTDTETVEGHFATSGWCEPIKICFVCPCWGVSGAFRWAVFVHGRGFQGEAAVQLVKDDESIESIKSWVINDSLIYAVFDLRDAGKGWYDVRVILANGCEGILNHGFLVMGWFGCLCGCSKEYPGGEDRLALDKELDKGDPERMLITLRGDMPAIINSPVLVSRDRLISGKIIERGRKKVLLEFQLHGAPLVEYDLLLVSIAGWRLLFEGAVSPKDRYKPVSVISIQPESAPCGRTVELRIRGERITSDVELWLEKNGLTLYPTVTHLISGSQVNCVFDLVGAAPGIYDLVAQGRNGAPAVLPACFTIYEEDEKKPEDDTPVVEDPLEKIPFVPVPSVEPEPVDFRIEPPSGPSGDMADVTVDGGPFYDGMKARLRDEEGQALAYICERVSESRLMCRFNLYNLPVGIYRLEIIDGDGNEIYIAGEFEVTGGE